MTPGKQSRSRVDLERQYKEHWRFLEKSCRDFDNGDESEAKRIAVSLRVLLHEHGQSRSLLGQIGLDKALFFDTAEDVRPDNLMPTFGLVFAALRGERTRFVAPLDQALGRAVWMLAFEKWWKKVVISIPGTLALSRKDLVLVTTNQDGGAHVDPSIDERYYRLTRENALGFVVDTPSGPQPLEGIEGASIRQIAHEVRASLIRPRRTIPPDLPETTPQPLTVVTSNAQTGETTCRVVVPRLACPCKSGLTYQECHAAGGRNEGQ